MAALGRGPIPYYHQISSILLDKITAGELVAEDRLPSEQQLQEMFHVSRATVRQALQVLEREGVIERRPGKGSFVAQSRRPVAEVKMTCLIDDLISLGIPGRNVVSDARIVSASAAVAEAMRVARGDGVFTFQRLVMVEGEPFASHRIYLPVEARARLTDSDLADPHLLRTLGDKCNLRADTAEHSIEAVLADSVQADLLHVEPGTALLSVSRTTIGRSGSPIEHSVTLYRSDRTRFHITQRQKSSQKGTWALSSQGPRGAVPPGATRPRASS